MFGQHGIGEAGDGLLVGEDTDDVALSIGFAVEPFEGIGGPVECLSRELPEQPQTLPPPRSASSSIGSPERASRISATVRLLSSLLLRIRSGSHGGPSGARTSCSYRRHPKGRGHAPASAVEVGLMGTFEVSVLCKVAGRSIPVADALRFKLTISWRSAVERMIGSRHQVMDLTRALLRKVAWIERRVAIGDRPRWLLTRLPVG